MKWMLSAGCLLLAGCSEYSRFTLPRLALPAVRGELKSVELQWSVRPNPVLPRGAAGGWDDDDVLNPSVVHAQGSFWNLYSGFDGRTWHTGVAVSPDGLVWTKRGKILSPDPNRWEGDYIAANGTALYETGKFLYWYQGGRRPRIGLATSTDGVQWSKLDQPVLDVGPRGSWDERGVADPYVLRVGDSLYMYYLGQDRARRQRLGVARSQDGVRWQKHRDNPILELGEPGMFDAVGLGEPAVWAEQGWYWMLYTARDRVEHRRLGLARSRDGIQWSRVTQQPVLQGGQEWNAAVVCDPHVIPHLMPQGDGSVVYFGGGNRPEPAERLNGAIGYATLRLTLSP